MSDGQHEVQRSIDADNARWTQCMDCRDRDDCHLRNLGHTDCEWHQGPPLAYQATGGAGCPECKSTIQPGYRGECVTCLRRELNRLHSGGRHILTALFAAADRGGWSRREIHRIADYMAKQYPWADPRHAAEAAESEK